MMDATERSLGSDSAQLRRIHLELWRSLISSLRGYSLDPNLEMAAVTVTESAPANAVAVCGGAKLKLSLDLANGIGEWSLEPSLLPENQERFQIHEAGTVSWKREEKEFDVAAIEWIRDLARHSERRQGFQKP